MNPIIDAILNESQEAQQHIEELITTDAYSFTRKECLSFSFEFTSNSMTIMYDIDSDARYSDFINTTGMYEYIRTNLYGELIDMAALQYHFTESITNIQSTIDGVRDKSIYVLTIL